MRVAIGMRLFWCRMLMRVGFRREISGGCFRRFVSLHLFGKASGGLGHIDKLICQILFFGRRPRARRRPSPTAPPAAPIFGAARLQVPIISWFYVRHVQEPVASDAKIDERRLNARLRSEE